MVSYLSLRHVVIPSDCCQDAIDGFYIKFWWSQELSCLKENAIQSNEIWKAAGRPRTGPIEPILRNIRDVVMHYLPLKKLLNILLRRLVKYTVPLSMRQKH